MGFSRFAENPLVPERRWLPGKRDGLPGNRPRNQVPENGTRAVPGWREESVPLKGRCLPRLARLFPVTPRKKSFPPRGRRIDFWRWKEPTRCGPDNGSGPPQPARISFFSSEYGGAKGSRGKLKLRPEDDCKFRRGDVQNAGGLPWPLGFSPPRGRNCLQVDG